MEIENSYFRLYKYFTVFLYNFYYIFDQINAPLVMITAL